MTNSIAFQQAQEEKIKGASCLIPGQLVDNKYRVERCLGTGTMGEVYLCSHVGQRGALYAMKVLRLSEADLEANPDMLTRFENEAKTSYLVDHPNVVGSFSFIRCDGLVAFTMEYIPGGDLADCISAERCLPIDSVIRILLQACRGVMAIHAAGIVHRDLKPENLLLTKDGNVKITDFGIARIEHSQRLTAHGGLLGTVDYLSPEYLLDGICDERSDLYALGLIGYEMLTGKKPFKGNSVVETLRNKLEATVKAPHRSRPTCPRALSDIILKALEREPELRYQSADEMLSDLEALASPVRERLRKLLEIEPSPVIVELGHSGPTLTSSGNLPTTDLKSHIKVPKIVTGLFGRKGSSASSLRSVAWKNNRKSLFLEEIRNFFLTLGELPFRVFWGIWRGPLFGKSRIGEITFLSILAAASLVVATSFFLP